MAATLKFDGKGGPYLVPDGKHGPDERRKDVRRKRRRGRPKDEGMSTGGRPSRFLN